MDLVQKIATFKTEITFFSGLFVAIIIIIHHATYRNVMLLLIWGIIIWYYIQHNTTTDKNTVELLDKENTTKLEVPEIATKNYYVKSTPKKGLKYLKNNETLLKIAQKLIFVKTFDSQKYQEMLIYMNAYQKVYMYILAERYLSKSYVPTFLDLRENILELMYQFYIVVPKDFKHIYGVTPYAEIKNNIHAFLKLSRTMIEVLENFCRLDLKDEYFPTTLPMPHDIHNKTDKANILP